MICLCNIILTASVCNSIISMYLCAEWILYKEDELWCNVATYENYSILHTYDAHFLFILYYAFSYSYFVNAAGMHAVESLLKGAFPGFISESITFVAINTIKTTNYERMDWLCRLTWYGWQCSATYLHYTTLLVSTFNYFKSGLAGGRLARRAGVESRQQI